jgi:membrane protein YqaA with SNARE-associated domain
MGACAGALAGTAALFAVASRAPARTADVLAALPGLDRIDLAEVEAQLASDGLIAVVRAPLAGMPVKVFTLAAARLGIPLPSLLTAVAVNRLVRIGLVGAVAGLAGRRFAGPVERNRRRVGVSYVLAWSGFYVLYFATR